MRSILEILVTILTSPSGDKTELLVSAESTRVEAVDAGHQPAAEVPDETFALLKSFLQF